MEKAWDKVKAAEIQPVQCPVCKARICDAIQARMKVRVLRHGGLLRMKCRRCGHVVGISVEMEKSRAL